MSKRTELLTAFVFAIIGVYMVFSSQSMTAKIANDIGPGFVPKLVGIGFILLSISKVLFTLNAKAKTVKKSKPENRVMLIKGLATIALFSVYVVTFKYLGFILTSILYLFFEILILKWEGQKFLSNLKTTVLVSVLVPTAIYFFFTVVLDLMLPSGFFS